MSQYNRSSPAVASWQNVSVVPFPAAATPANWNVNAKPVRSYISLLLTMEYEEVQLQTSWPPVADVPEPYAHFVESWVAKSSVRVAMSLPAAPPRRGPSGPIRFRLARRS